MVPESWHHGSGVAKDMEECSDFSISSNEEEPTVCPGPLFRVKLAVLGPAQSGKSTLVQFLLHSDMKKAEIPKEDVQVDLWYPFRTHNLQRLFNRKLTGEERHLILEVWDFTGRQVCSPVHNLFLTQQTLCIIVYDVTDDSYADKVFTYYQMIQEKCPGGTVFLVGNKADKLNSANSARESSDREEKVLQVLRQYDTRWQQEILQEIDELKTMLKESSEYDDKAESGSKSHSENKTASQSQLQKNAEDVADVILWERISELQKTLDSAKTVAAHLTVTVSAATGKGLDELKKRILETIIEPKYFPNRLSHIDPSTILLYDEILGLRERDVIMLKWREYEDLAQSIRQGRECVLGVLEYLEAVGAVVQFQLGGTTFPPVDLDFAEENKLQRQRDHCYTKDDDCYICVHPAAFANCICSCLIDDDKKSFRFEAGRFWPRDSGFKHPDPALLCRVLEAIPQQGLLRECLLPLLWQGYSLTSQQVQRMVMVMRGTGLLAPHNEVKKYCEGLAMPAFHELSVQRCFALPLLNLLPDKRPLNWTARPFPGDIQVSWCLTLQYPSSLYLLRRIPALVLFFSRHSSTYQHLWKTGGLVRIAEATLCIEHQCDDRLELACRVNGDEEGHEEDAVRMLWVVLAPLVLQVRHFLLAYPGVLYKETLVAYGHQFYLDKKVEKEPELRTVQALRLWHQQTNLTFPDGNAVRELDIKLLFPFKPTAVVTNFNSWLELVKDNSKKVLKDGVDEPLMSILPANNGSTTPGQSATSQRNSFLPRGSFKLGKKKKRAEVKWQLEESDNNNNEKRAAPLSVTKLDNSVTKLDNSVTKLDNSVTKLDNSVTKLDNSDKEYNNQEGHPCRVLTKEDMRKEAERVASGFVATVMATALADYVTMEARGDQNGSKLIAAAQIAAARATADAALAAQAGDIEGAANAVISAVQAVQRISTTEVKEQETRHQSRLCTLL